MYLSTGRICIDFAAAGWIYCAKTVNKWTSQTVYKFKAVILAPDPFLRFIWCRLPCRMHHSQNRIQFPCCGEWVWSVPFHYSIISANRKTLELAGPASWHHVSKYTAVKLTRPGRPDVQVLWTRTGHFICISQKSVVPLTVFKLQAQNSHPSPFVKASIGFPCGRHNLTFSHYPHPSSSSPHSWHRCLLSSRCHCCSLSPSVWLFLSLVCFCQLMGAVARRRRDLYPILTLRSVSLRLLKGGSSGPPCI